MGCTESDDKDNENQTIKSSIPVERNVPFFEPFLQSKDDKNFNFPEVEEEIYVGKGLKRMKGYISPISKEDLEKKRAAFWGTRTEGKEQTWNFLKELCQMPEGEEENINAMLVAYDLIPYNNCINITYDSLGGLYEIPNYCINEPYKYEINENKNKPEEGKVQFHLRKGAKQLKITCSNWEKIDKVKSKVAKKFNSDTEKIRLFFYGKEMMNSKELWNYKVTKDCVVIVMIKED